MKFVSFITDKIVILLIANVCLFYSCLEEKFPHFIFKCRTSIEQIIEGILVLVPCIIPKYEETPKK